VFHELLAVSPDTAVALEGLGVAALRQLRTSEALEWLERAARAAPNNAQILAHLGIAQKQSGLVSEAIATYRRAIALDPRPALILNLARAEQGNGQLEQAIQSFRRAIALKRDAPDAWSMLSHALCTAGRFEEARSAARECLVHDPRWAEGHLNEGVALHRLGRLPEAVASYWVASTLPATSKAANGNLRVALARMQQEKSAPLAQALVLRLLSSPTDRAALLQLGQLELGRPALAIACLERALELMPDAAVQHELGVLWWGLGHKPEADRHLQAAFDGPDADVPRYQRLGAWLVGQPRYRLTGAGWQAILERCPDDVPSLVNLGIALQQQGRPSEAARLQQRAIALCPDRVEAHVNHGSALSDQGRFDEAVLAYRRGLELSPGCASIASNLLLCLHFDPRLDPQTIFTEHVAFGERFADPLLPTPRSLRRSRDPERRLRLGYVSPDFRWHPVAYFIEPVLAEHSRQAFEVHCYSDTPRPDAVTARLGQQVSQFVSCSGWSDARLAERIQEDEIDILVDLAGHTGNNRMLVFARKPSPIQVSWIGYFDTTGLTAIDYRIADRFSVPEEQTRLFVERIVHLPRSANCFLPPESPLPAAAPCLTRGYVTFGCFNNPAKITRGVVAVFGRILRQVADSRLILKYGAFDDPELRARYLSWLGEEGISGDRVEILGHSSLPHFLTCFAQIDVALDPFPYSGETTALHTLWMGVPLVALEGETLVQRLASRVLRVAGLSEWVASSESDYVRIASTLAQDRLALARRRAALRDILRASPLLDHAGVTRELESAYRQMWRTWCSA
jgi:predicted O-linked N-acetylglucosamine transferase (SPINDLY family)